MKVNEKVGYRMPIVAEMPQLKDITAQLAGIGNNLNQIARHLQTGGLLTDELQKDIKTCVENVMQMRKEVLTSVGDYRGNSQTLVLQKHELRKGAGESDLPTRRAQRASAPG